MTCPRCGTVTDSWPCPECGFPEIIYNNYFKRRKTTLEATASKVKHVGILLNINNIKQS